MLGVRWLGDCLPLVCVTLTSLDRTVRIGVLLWSAAARNWLSDVLTHRQLSVVLEDQTGSSALSAGDVELTGRGFADLLDFEYAVELEDRGHALRAAAVTLLAQAPQPAQTVVLVATETHSDIAELLKLQSVEA